MNQNSLITKQHTFRYNPGSTESQIAFLTDRVIQLSTHLKTHRKDYSSRRGLKRILGTRKRLLVYLFKEDISRYNRIINHLGIRATRM